MATNNVETGVLAGRNLKKLMKKNGLTQVKFGEEFGVDERTVRSWQKCIKYLDTIDQIAHFFNISTQDFIFGDLD